MTRAQMRLSFAGIFALLVAGMCGAYIISARVHSEPEPAAEIPPRVATSTHAIIGHTVEGRSIDAYTYGTGPRHLLLVGGVHGGYEWNAVVLAYEFKQYLDTHPEFVPSDVTIALIPDLNVDGTFKVIGKEGALTAADIRENADAVPGRLNAHDVDLNRNFDCRWKPEATWRNNPVSGGTAPFSEPESMALRKFIGTFEPEAVIFWHSQSGTVYAAECGGDPAPGDLDLMHTYATAAGYKTSAAFDAYPVTGDSEGWLASIGIPAITVELTTHADVEWDKNLAGVKAVLSYRHSR